MNEIVGGVRRTKVLIVGSGGNGISAAVLLKQAGIEDFVIITKHNDFGGVWHQNTYPGCGVDGAISIYQFSFAINPEWSTLFAKQPEVAAYLRKVAADHDLYARTRFGTEMLGAEWLEDSACWSVSTTGGTYHADALVLVTGFLEEPVFPKIPGVDSFEGRIFHSSMWPEGYTGEGDRIAVVGTGSSALQIVPSMQKAARQVTVFQRTPAWILPKNDRVFTAEDMASFRESPEILLQQRQEIFEYAERMWENAFLMKDPAESQKFEDMARAYLEEQVPDPELRRMLTPDHQFACKRPGASDDYYAALQEENVELVAEGTAEIGAGSIRSTGGREFEVDTIVLATGFLYGGHVLHKIKRRDGRTVGEVQQGHPRAYKSVEVSGCPNLFLIGGAGPNGQNWNGLACGEVVGAYLVKVLQYMEEHGIRAVEVHESAETEWKRRTDEILAHGPTVAGGCVNYSQDDTGHNKAAYPGNQREMEAALSKFETAVHHVIA
ncbi:flavin-containing monooxygenase [Streptomyces fulvoviolaceus]|uniref:flavin-containing monooxygenase n=1 Tax=Streptomyces fulvoviolaceus TaxID=285535 RepID=UPI0004CA6473|nr:NAD(P)/FAD-dependent oxidoreductase [Streptomyces fulvoviolaceus]